MLQECCKSLQAVCGLRSAAYGVFGSHVEVVQGNDSLLPNPMSHDTESLLKTVVIGWLGGGVRVGKEGVGEKRGAHEEG